MSIPFRIVVGKVVSPRYHNKDPYHQLSRPLSWDERHAGVDVVEDQEGKTYQLASLASQSSPQTGWELLLTDCKSGAYSWTLYGIKEV